LFTFTGKGFLAQKIFSLYISGKMPRENDETTTAGNALNKFVQENARKSGKCFSRLRNGALLAFARLTQFSREHLIGGPEFTWFVRSESAAFAFVKIPRRIH